MSDPVSNPFLDLVKERGMLDDLQLEEVLQEHKRSGKSIEQILQDFGIIDLDTQLQIKADHLGTSVIGLDAIEFTPEILQSIPADTARLYQALPVAVYDTVVQVALVDPLNISVINELGFIAKKEIQAFVADPAQIEKALSKHY